MRAELVALPTAQDVLTFLATRDASAPKVEQTGKHVAHMTAIVRAYTRGRGFVVASNPDDATRVAADLAAVIVTASARMLTNPAGIRETSADGVASQTFNEFRGFNLAETMVLNTHRRRVG